MVRCAVPGAMEMGELVPMAERYCTTSTGYWYHSAVHDEHGRSKTSDRSFHNPYATVGQIVLSWMGKKAEFHDPVIGDCGCGGFVGGGGWGNDGKHFPTFLVSNVSFSYFGLHGYKHISAFGIDGYVPYHCLLPL